ncbi:hypothetical protein D3C73_882310 [compost metagenome]
MVVRSAEVSGPFRRLGVMSTKGASAACHHGFAVLSAGVCAICEGRPCRALPSASRRCSDCTRGPAPNASSALRSCTSAWRRFRPSLSGRSASAVAASAYSRREPATSSANARRCAAWVRRSSASSRCTAWRPWLALSASLARFSSSKALRCDRPSISSRSTRLVVAASCRRWLAARWSRRKASTVASSPFSCTAVVCACASWSFCCFCQ